jgi:hypothetical protein
MRFAFIVVVVVGIAGCRSAYASGQPAGSASSLPVTRLRPGDEAFSTFSGIADSVRLVVRDSAAWRRAWQAIHRPFIPQPPIPRIDFGHEMVIVAALGRRPSEGYGIVIEDAAQDSGAITVGIRKTSPGTGCLLSAAVTQPVDVARLPASEQPVLFRERNVVVPCGVR